MRPDYGYVYVLRRHSDGLVKCGSTASLVTRLRTHRTQSGPFEVLMVRGSDDYWIAEKEGHAWLAERGERIRRTDLFRVADDVIADIREEGGEGTAKWLETLKLYNLP